MVQREKTFCIWYTSSLGKDGQQHVDRFGRKLALHCNMECQEAICVWYTSGGRIIDQQGSNARTGQVGLQGGTQRQTGNKRRQTTVGKIAVEIATIRVSEIAVAVEVLLNNALNQFID